MDNISQKDLFKDYYFNNKGILFKSFEIRINNFHYSYDIYWGDPNIIFDERALKNAFPLAITIIPHRHNYPKPRIFLHEKLDKNNINAFEMIIAHEIGHLWLHDIVGFNNPSTSNFMNENDSEIWSDYFAYSFFVKYRNINNLENFYKILNEASNLQIEIYNLESGKYMELTYTQKTECLRILENKIYFESKNENFKINQMINAIEITLDKLGDIFK